MSSPERRAGVKPTISEQVDAVGFGKFQWISLTAFVLFIFSDGMEMVVTNVIWRVLPLEEWGMEDDVRGLLISISFLGFVIGALMGGIAGDWVGRLAVVYAHTIIFIPASIASAFSQSMYQLLVTRFFVGISMGLILPTAVALMAEFSPRVERGRACLAIPGLSFTSGAVGVLMLGLILMSFCGMECEHCDWWRVMLVAGVIPDIIAITLVLVYLPESPRFLLCHGRVQEAEAAVHRIAETNDAEQKLIDGGVLAPLPPDDIQSAEKAQQHMAAMFKPPIIDYMFVIVGTWSLLSIATWVQTFLYPLVLEEKEMNAADQYWLLIQMTAIEFPGVLLMLFIIQYNLVERRHLMAYLAMGSMLASIIAAITIEWGLVWVHSTQLLLRFCSMLPYEVFYVYAAELLPTSHRNQGISFGNGTTKGLAVITPLIIIPLFHVSHYLPYVIVAISSFLATVVLFFFAPDPSYNLNDVVSQAIPAEKRPLIQKMNSEVVDTAPGV